MSLIVVLLASFTVYIYSFTTIVLGDIYTAFPGQDSVTVLIASLPAVVMMISAFASAFLLAKFNRKLLVIISMVIAVAAGLVVAYVEIPVAGIYDIQFQGNQRSVVSANTVFCTGDFHFCNKKQKRNQSSGCSRYSIFFMVCVCLLFPYAEADV